MSITQYLGIFAAIYLARSMNEKPAFWLGLFLVLLQVIAGIYHSVGVTQ